MRRQSSHDNPDSNSVIKEEDESDDDDEEEEEKYADAMSSMSIHGDEESEVVKRSTLKREKIRAGKYHRSNRNSPNLLDRLKEDRRSYSQLGKA